jgi:hypothetical protein
MNNEPSLSTANISDDVSPPKQTYTMRDFCRERARIKVQQIPCTNTYTSTMQVEDNVSLKAEHDIVWFGKTSETILINIGKNNILILELQTTDVTQARLLEFDNLRNITHLYDFVDKYVPCIYEFSKTILNEVKCVLHKQINETKQKLETHKYIPRTRIEIITIASLRDAMASCEKTLNELV